MRRGRSKPLRVVVDPNVLLSILIGRALGGFFEALVVSKVEILWSVELFKEFREVAERQKFRKYFSLNRVDYFIEVLEVYGIELNVERSPMHISRDPKDDYLLLMADIGNADVLITGDKDLLVLENYKGTAIMSAAAFAKAHL